MDEAAHNWSRVVDFMQRNCGVSLASEQSYLLASRVEPVAKQFKFGSVDSFVTAVCKVGSKDPLFNALVDAMTTHESSFFRDVPFWAVMESTVLPTLEALKKPQLRIWSAAASHGQEPYSLAILLQEKWPALAASCSIVATDISEAATLRGKNGVYTSLEVNRGLSALRLIHHFEKAEGGFRLKESIRKRVSWQVHNLMEAPPGGETFDLVMCRNVLIYFNDKDRKLVVERLRSATCAGGYIGTGTGESAFAANVAPGWHCNPGQGGRL